MRYGQILKLHVGETFALFFRLPFARRSGLVPAARGQQIVKTRGECPAVAKRRRRREASRTAAGRPVAWGGQAVERSLRSIWLFDRSDQ